MTFYNVVFYDSLSINNIVEWFVDEVLNPEKKIFSFENTEKDIMKTQKDEEKYRNITIC